ncbi:MAG: hypothetical protein U9R41_07000, partial [Candidatus Marinimicrobia bacterium]|nr:hypothetical protein [Candidatus Neomarinimicrobiota bacterium]
NKKEPEIIFDAPYRLAPNKSLPISLIIKDSHLYPIEIDKIEITGSDDEIFLISNPKTIVNQLLYYEIFSIPFQKLEKYKNETISITPTIEYKVNKKKKTAVTHNFKQLSHSPLKIFIASESFPNSDKFLWSDLHIHSFYTHDQVEFGAPVETISKTAEAIGLNSIAITDHSYDLDDTLGEHYLPDKDFTRWKNLKTDSEKYSTENLSILFGEEVSCGNKKNQNVHFLVINNEKFIAGNGDGAENWLKRKPNHFCKDIKKMTQKNALLIAAHPNEKVPFLQKILLNRGNWSFKQSEWLNGFQIMNGKINDKLDESIKLWAEQLIEGKKFFIYAGNDSHGNFNKYRQIKTPMISLTENDEQLLGKHRTGTIANNNKSDILNSLKNGKCFITNSFSIDIKIVNELGNIFELGESANGNEFTIKIKCESNREFGKMENLKIFFGNLKEKQEKVIFEKEINDLTYSHKFILQERDNGYIRAEIESGENKNKKFAATNPIW